MTGVSLLHARALPSADDGNPNHAQSADWNEEHPLLVTANNLIAGDVDGNATAVPLGRGLSLAGGVLASPLAMLGSVMNKFAYWFPNTGANAPITSGAVTNTGGALSTIKAVAGNPTSRQIRSRFTSNTGASSGAGYGWADQRVPISASDGIGGCYAEMIFSLGANVTGQQGFFGMFSGFGVYNDFISHLVDCIGVGFASTDAATGNWQVYHNDANGGPVSVDTGIPRNVNTAMLLQLRNLPGSLDWTLALTDMNAGTVYAPAPFTTDTPTDGVIMAPTLSQLNGSTGVSCLPETMGGFVSWDVS